MSSLSDETRLRQLRAEAVKLLEQAKSPTYRRQALTRLVEVLKEQNRLMADCRPDLRTVEQAYKDLSAGRLR